MRGVASPTPPRIPKRARESASWGDDRRREAVSDDARVSGAGWTSAGGSDDRLHGSWTPNGLASAPMRGAAAAGARLDNGSWSGGGAEARAGGPGGWSSSGGPQLRRGLAEDDGFRDAAEAGAPAGEELHVLFACCAGRGGHVGLAYVDLDAQERTLFVADVLDPSFAQLLALKHALLGDGRRQGLCVVPSRSPAALMEQASQPLVGPSETTPFPVAVLKATDFEFDHCRQRLSHLRIGCMGTGAGGGQENRAELPTVARELRARSFLDLDNEQTVRAAGGLVRFMEKNRSTLGDLDSPDQPLHVHSVRLFSPESLLCIDMQTMAALQVFHSDHHPSMIRGSGRPKEGLSLYGILEPFVASLAGRATLRRWLRQPSRDLCLLLERQDVVEELARMQRAEFLREVGRELREVRDVAALLRRVFGCYHFDNVHDWQALSTTLEHMVGAFALVQGEALGGRLECFRDLIGLVSDLSAAEDMLRRVVDFEASATHGEVRVRAGIDEQLDAVREQYESVDSYLTEVARLERNNLATSGLCDDLVNDLAFHYFPQLGFHVSVPNPLSEELGGDGDAAAMERLKQAAASPAEDWRYQFAGSGRLFYKCPLASRLDAEIGDLVVAARELELELLLGIVERLRRFEPRLCRAAQVLADFDALAGLALAAREFGWKRPTLLAGEPRRLRIVKGRHPLAEAVLSGRHSFVPNDTDLGSNASSARARPGRRREDEPCEETRASAEGRMIDVGGNGETMPVVATRQLAGAHVQVVTGANLAGKSVYLKQVGLMVVMAQVGSFVPAESAELGLCDFLFTRIQNCEGAAVRCSTFGVDLTQVSRALRHATEASLVLLDEFGKGTQSTDGVALLAATLEYLCRLPHTPKSVVTTHFLEVFRFGLVDEEEPGLQLSSMRVLPPEESGGEAAYLYQLVPGIASRSLGLECARRAGMDASVLARSREILDALERGISVPTAVGRASPLAGFGARASALDAFCGRVLERLRLVDASNAAAVAGLLAMVQAEQGLLSAAAA